MGMRCWSYCQARAGQHSHSGEERAKQHPMALGMRHPAVKARPGHTTHREKRDANSLPACTRNSSRRCPVPLSARAQLAPSHRAQTCLLLPASQPDRRKRAQQNTLLCRGLGGFKPLWSSWGETQGASGERKVTQKGGDCPAHSLPPAPLHPSPPAHPRTSGCKPSTKQVPSTHRLG